ncbi:Ig-like domain-containing protein [Dyella silvatica]|uniref:Ig-like domain-containing protein n=1 Tax=Dyella silvatica TaxID=2992128 RepID=UPI00224F348F|nr:Ig-like domain-containing protein [Dyella silvatica]
MDTVASGGTLVIDESVCSPAGISPGTVQPSQGTLTVGAFDLTYVNNGDSSTTDTFNFLDENSVLVTVNLTIGAGGATPITISPGTLPSATVSSAYTTTVTASGGNGGPYTYFISAGALPIGLSDTTGGVISGTPTEGGVFTFTITASDGTHEGVQTYNLNVNGIINVSPLTLPVGYTGTAYNQPISATGGTAPYTVTLLSGSLPAGLSLSGNALIGTPTTVGTSSFALKVTDAANISEKVSYSLVVQIPPPTAGAVSATVAYGSTNNPITLNTTGSLASVAVASAASHGTATASGTAITYTPAAGYSGSDSFTYTATNSSGTSAPATVTITVNPQLPVAGAASVTVLENSSNNPVTLALSGGAATSVAVAGAAGHGTATASGTSITYTPTNGYIGSDSFTYTATNAAGTSTPATVTVTVNPLVPIVSPVSSTVAYGSSANPIALLISGATPTSVAVASAASHGTATASGITISYTPAAGYSGSDSFTYTASDASGTSTPATVTITVTAQPPVAAAVSTTVLVNSTNNAVALSLSGGAPTSVTVASAASHGTATASGTTITYTPTAGYTGSDSFTYTATNTGGTSAPATVTVTVNPLIPTVSAVSATVAYGSTNDPITLSISGAATSVAVASGATHGTATATGTAITYTPAAGYSGSDSFTYTASNVTGTSTPATVTITVTPQPPVAGAASVTVTENSSNNPVTLSFSGGAPASVAVATAASHGTATASGTSISYTPTSGFMGSDSFTYTVTNAGGTSAPATVSVTVNPLIPTVGAVSATVAYGSASNPISLSISGVATSVAVATGAAHGTATASGTSMTYTPAAGYSGSDSFSYTASNVTGTSTPATVTITVTPQAPVAGAVTTTVLENSSGNAVPLSLSGGAAASVAVAGAASHGTATASGTSITYTPTSGFTGSDSFTYTVTNAGGTSAPATVSVTVNPLIPVVSAVSATVAYGSASDPISLSISGTATSVAVVSGAAHGTATASGTSISYTPAAGYSGGDSFTYTASNVTGTSTPATVTITVTPQIPVAGAVTTTVLENSAGNAVPLSLSGGAPASVAVASAASQGSATASGTSISYTPTNGYTGPDSFTYTASNAGGTSSPATVNVTVNPPIPGVGAVSANVAYDSTGNAITLSISGAATSVAVAGAASHGTATASGITMSYTPTAGYAGPDSFTYTASNVTGTSAPATVSITVGTPSIVVTPSAPLSTQVGVPYTQTYTFSGGAAPYSGYSVSNLPQGLSITATTTNSVTISGTPQAYGSFNETVSATDSSTGSGPFVGSHPFVLTTTAATLTMAPASGTLTVTYGSPYSQAFTTSGGTSPYTYAETGTLPAGIVFNAATGSLSGTATQTGSFPITINSTDHSVGVGAPFSTGPISYTLSVSAPHIVFATTSLPGGTVAAAYPATSLNASGGIAPYGYQITAGALPAGLTLNATSGQITGTPTASGSFALTVMATDAHNQTGTQSYTLAINMATLALTPSSLPNGVAETAYNQNLVASGGITPYTYAVSSGALPTGVTLNASSGSLTGTPTVAGHFAFAIRVVDSSTGTGSPAMITVNYTIDITAPAITESPSSLPNPQVGASYSQTISASGGRAPYSYSVSAGALPAGLTLSASGVLSGTPTSPSSYTFSVTAKDSLNFTGTQSYTVVVGQPVPIVVNDTATTPANALVTIPVTNNDTGPITSIAIVQMPAHGSASVSGLNVLYTPSNNYYGSDSLTYTASGPGGTSSPATVSITVAPLAVPVALPQTATVLAGKPVTIHATVGASGGPFTVVAIATPPSTGVASVSGNDIVYTPAADASGRVSFSYTVANAFGVSLPATITVTVNPLPVAASLSATALAGTTVPVDLTAGARGGPFTAANLVSISPSNAGSGTIQATATGYVLNFTAAATFSGVAQLSYTLSNAYATSAPGSLAVTVTPRSDPSKDAEVMGILDAQADAARRMATGQINNFQRRLESLHSGSGDSGFSNGITFSSGGGRQSSNKDPFLGMSRGNSPEDEGMRRYFMQAADAPADPVGRHGSSAAGLPGDISVWTGGAVNFGTRELGASANGIDFTTSGLSVGADKRIDPSLAVGVGLGYGHDASDVGNKGSRSTVDSYNVAAYASYRPTESTYLDGLVGYQWLSFDARRYVTANGNIVTGSRDGGQWFGSLAFGYEHRGDMWLLSPYGRLDVANAKLDSYTEHGDAIYALNYQSQTVKTFTGSLGLRAQWQIKADYGMWMPTARVEYQRDLQGASQATMSYADLLSGPLYHATLDNQSRNHTLLGIGIQLQTLRGWTLRFEYQNLLDNSSQDNQSILFGVEKKFNP